MDDEINMLDIEALQKKFSGTFDIDISELTVNIFFEAVHSDSFSTKSGFYQFHLDSSGRLHMHYQYELDEPDKDPDKDSFWRECYIYVRE